MTEHLLDGIDRVSRSLFFSMAEHPAAAARPVPPGMVAYYNPATATISYRSPPVQTQAPAPAPAESMRRAIRELSMATPITSPGTTPRETTPRREWRAVVFGAINMDVKASATTSWPTHDASVMGEFKQMPGGKGANEAVALSRLGIRTALIGRVGTDANGHILRRYLSDEEGVDVSGIVQEGTTGTAVQIVTSIDNRKFNVSCPEANHAVDDRDVGRVLRQIRAWLADGCRLVCLLQYELQISPMVELMRRLRESHLRVPVAFKPSPLLKAERVHDARRLLEMGVGLCFVNETEAPLMLSGERDFDWDVSREPLLCTLAQAERAADSLMHQFPLLLTVVITFSSGHLLHERGGGWLAARGEVNPTGQTIVVPRQKSGQTVDIIGAADAFIGAFVAAQLRGRSAAESLVWAHGAGTRSTQASGAVKGMPTTEEVVRFVSGHDPPFDTTGCAVTCALVDGAREVSTMLSVGEHDDPKAANWLHLAVLRAEMKAAWKLLPSTSLTNEHATKALEGMLSRLRVCDAFGLAPIERAHQAWRICPNSDARHREQMRACLRLLVTVHLLLAPSYAKSMGSLGAAAPPSLVPIRSRSTSKGGSSAHLPPPIMHQRSSATSLASARGSSHFYPEEDKEALSPALCLDQARPPAVEVAHMVLALLGASAERAQKIAREQPADYLAGSGDASGPSGPSDVGGMSGLGGMSGPPQPVREPSLEKRIDAEGWQISLARAELEATLRVLARTLCPVLEGRWSDEPSLRKELLDATDVDGASLLLLAARAGCDAIVRSLFSQPVRTFLRELDPASTRHAGRYMNRDERHTDHAGRDALFHAVDAGPSRAHKECVLLLLTQSKLELRPEWASDSKRLDGKTPWRTIVTDLHRFVRGDGGGHGGVFQRRCAGPLPHHFPCSPHQPDHPSLFPSCGYVAGTACATVWRTHHA